MRNYTFEDKNSKSWTVCKTLKCSNNFTDFLGFNWIRYSIFLFENADMCLLRNVTTFEMLRLL